MKILQVHNKYQLSGGEDVVVENERRLLESKGNSVFQFVKDNKEINGYSFLKKVNLINSTVWSKESFRELKKLIKTVEPDICHVHNYMPLISPAVFYACHEMKIPVVQTLHNYRMLCSNAYLFRNGKVCEDCIGKSLYNGVKYGCYRDSKIQTFIVARMIEIHKRKRTWNNIVNGYITFNNFLKNKLIKSGLPADKIFIKPNFLFEDTVVNFNTQNHFLFAGRLEVAKGIEVLLNSLKYINENIKILIAGDGLLRYKIQLSDKIIYNGQLIRKDLLNRIQESIAVIFPSISYEGMPMLIIESFACGKPVIASNLGSMAELIQDGKTGLLFEPGNSEDLANKVNWAYTHKEEMKLMGINARKEYEEKYTADRNYEILMEIYQNLKLKCS